MSESTALERELCRAYSRESPDEAATELERAPPAQVAAWLEALDATEAGAMLGRLVPGRGAHVLSLLKPETAAAVVATMDPPQASRLVGRLGDEERKALLSRVAPGLAGELTLLASFPPGSAGALMDPQVLALRAENTVAEALTRLREVRHKRVYRIYLVDSAGKLVGAVRVRDLALTEPRVRLEELMLDRVPSVPTLANREIVAELIQRERVSSLPVVDFHGLLVGVLRHDTLFEAARDEASADVQSMFGAGKEERALSRVTFAVRKRLPWLQVNLLTAFLAASVVGLFESTIARFTALAVLLPVVAGQSGNTGAQALAVTMRGLALREIRVRHWFRVCVKEANVGLINGLAVALTTSLAVLAWSRSPGLAMVIGTSMVISMVAAGLAGAATPMVLTALRQDPAQSSSIILTTITDVVGFFSFLGIATALSGLL